MDLQTLQYQMWLAVKKYQVLISRRQEEPHNLAIQREILDVLCQLVSINENQKLVVAKLREERGNKHEDYDEQDQSRIDDEHGHEMQHPMGSSPRLSPCLPHSAKSPHNAEDGVVNSPFLDYSIERPNDSFHGSFEEPLDCSITGDLCRASEPSSPSSWWCSPEKRLHNFQPPTGDYTVEDVHDLVSEDEFMHALGLLTVGECEEVLAKRYERRKHSAYSHIFSSTIWEKPETRRKRRVWLTSGAGSPPNLRRKIRPLSQPPSRPESRPVSPSQSSCSPPTTYLPSQPTSPQSLEEDFPLASHSSEEVCPMCNVKGADIQCDGCGVLYHSHCVDLEDSYPPPCWLCLTCEQLGLRASSNSDPQHDSRRREVLEIREQLLRQRAELTVAKLQLQERKQHLAVAFESQQLERKKLQRKEDEVRRAIHQLHDFIYTFQQPGSPKIRSPSPEEGKNNACSADTSASSFSHNDTSDSALPSYLSSDQSSPVSSEEQTSLIKNFTFNKHLYTCMPPTDQTELPHGLAHASSCSPGSSPSHISQTCVPNKVTSHSPSPSQVSNSSSDQPLPQLFMSSQLKSSEPAAYQMHPFSSQHKSERSYLKKGKQHHHRSRLTSSKYSSDDRKAKGDVSMKHQSKAPNLQPKDLSTPTPAHSRQNGLPRMRRGESKPMTASI